MDGDAWEDGDAAAAAVRFNGFDVGWGENVPGTGVSGAFLAQGVVSFLVTGDETRNGLDGTTGVCGVNADFLAQEGFESTDLSPLVDVLVGEKTAAISGSVLVSAAFASSTEDHDESTSGFRAQDGLESMDRGSMAERLAIGDSDVLQDGFTDAGGDDRVVAGESVLFNTVRAQAGFVSFAGDGEENLETGCVAFLAATGLSFVST